MLKSWQTDCPLRRRFGGAVGFSGWAEWGLTWKKCRWSTDGEFWTLWVKILWSRTLSEPWNSIAVLQRRTSLSTLPAPSEHSVSLRLLYWRIFNLEFILIIMFQQLAVRNLERSPDAAEIFHSIFFCTELVWAIRKCLEDWEIWIHDNYKGYFVMSGHVTEEGILWDERTGTNTEIFWSKWWNSVVKTLGGWQMKYLLTIYPIDPSVL